MDEVFSTFVEEFGGVIERREVPPSSIERYKGKLPEKLLEYWADHGWCGYGDGIFWLVNPQEYEGVTASWIENASFAGRDTYHLIARGAFGDLYFWGENTGACLKITAMLSRYVLSDFDITKDEMDLELQGFLVSREPSSNDFGDFFKPAKKKLGTLRSDEMYGFVPAIMLGGPDKFGNLQKVKAVEHLIFLSQLAELQPYSFSDL